MLEIIVKIRGFPSGTVVKKPLVNAGGTRDTDLILGLGRSPGVGNGNLFQSSYLENSTVRRAWGATLHGVSKSRTQLSD